MFQIHVCVRPRGQHRLQLLVPNPCPSVPNKVDSHISWSVHTNPPAFPRCHHKHHSPPHPGKPCISPHFNPLGLFTQLYPFTMQIFVLLAQSMSFATAQQEFCFLKNIFLKDVLVMNTLWFRYIDLIKILYYCILFLYSFCGYIWQNNINICKHVAIYFMCLARGTAYISIYTAEFSFSPNVLVFWYRLYCTEIQNLNWLSRHVFPKLCASNHHIILYLHFLPH